MRSHFLTILAVLSLVLLMPAVVLWEDGHRVASWFLIDARTFMISQDGAVTVVRSRAPLAIGPDDHHWRGDRAGSAVLLHGLWRRTDGRRHAIGFGWGRSNPRFGPQFTMAVVPYWAITVVLAVTPLTWALIRARASSTVARCSCAACGYDLRTAAGACPECGLTVTEEERA